jgi:type III restriction enzyme
MQAHRREEATEYEATVSRGALELRSSAYTTAAGDGVRDVRAPVDDATAIKRMVFGGFRHCLYPEAKFR